MFYGQYEITKVEALKDGLTKHHYTHTAPDGKAIDLFIVLSEASAALLLSKEAVPMDTVNTALIHTVKTEILWVFSKYNIPCDLVWPIQNKCTEAIKFWREKVFVDITGQSLDAIGVRDIFVRSDLKDYI